VDFPFLLLLWFLRLETLPFKETEQCEFSLLDAFTKTQGFKSSSKPKLNMKWETSMAQMKLGNLFYGDDKCMHLFFLQKRGVLNKQREES